MAGTDTDIFPKKLPPHWKVVQRCRDGAAYVRCDDLLVVANTVREPTGARWSHVSCSREGMPPTILDLQAVKLLFMGPDRVAVQVLPDLHDIHSLKCLHLWSSLDGVRFPDVLRKR